MVREALKAAEALAKDGIEAEVVDPRTIVPLDAETICASVRKTGRLVTVDEGNALCSIGSEISALVAEHAFDALKAPILRVARPAGADRVLAAARSACHAERRQDRRGGEEGDDASGLT